MESDFAFDYGRALRVLRETAALDQSELAAKAGISTRTIGRIENEEGPPTLSTLLVILRALGATLHDFADAMDQINGTGPKAGAAARADPMMVTWLTWSMRKELDVASMFAALDVTSSKHPKAATIEASFLQAAREVVRGAFEELDFARQHESIRGEIGAIGADLVQRFPDSASYIAEATEDEQRGLDREAEENRARRAGREREPKKPRH